MFKRLPLVMSALALVVSLTGVGAYASNILINGTTIQNGTIGVAKLTPRAIHQLKGLPGPRGPRGFSGNVGPAGVDGQPGAAGAAGLPGGFNPAKVTYVTGPTITLGIYPDPSYTQGAAAICPAGSKAIAGGFFAGINQVGATDSSADGSQWFVILQNASGVSTTGNAYAVCAAP